MISFTMAKSEAGTTASSCAANDCGCEKSLTTSSSAKTTPPIKKAKVMSPAEEEENLLAIISPEHDGCKESSEQIVFLSNPNEFKDCIQREEVQLVVWRRSQIPDFIRQLSDPKKTPASTLPYFYGKVTPETVADLMEKKLSKQEGDLLPAEVRRELIQDVAQLVRAFDSVGRQHQQQQHDDDDDDDETANSSSPGVHVRLEALEDDGCRFWHQDTVPFRLVATYRGPCTEYVHPKFSQETLRYRRDDSKHTQSLTHYDVALFKGRAFHESPTADEEEKTDDEEISKKSDNDGNENSENKDDKNSDDDDDDDEIVADDSGIVHRSPRIEGKGVVRLVLVLDIPAIFHVDSDDEEEDSAASDDDDDNNNGSSDDQDGEED